MKVFNWFLILQGACILGFGAYIAALSYSSVVLLLGGIGLYVVIVGGIGVAMVRRRMEGCVTFYAVLFFVLVALHGALVIGMLFFEDQTFTWLADLSIDTHGAQIRSYIDAHHDVFKWSGLAVVAIEFLTFCMSVCCARSVSGSALDEELLGNNGYMPMSENVQGGRSTGIVLAGNDYGVSQHPITDKRREALNQKYGGLFQDRRSNQSMV